MLQKVHISRSTICDRDACIHAWQKWIITLYFEKTYSSGENYFQLPDGIKAIPVIYLMKSLNYMEASKLLLIVLGH